MHKLLEKRGLTFWLLEPNKKEDKILRERFQRLRYQKFVLERGWEPKNEARLEIDKYDHYSDYLVCVKNNDEVVAGCRLVPNEMPICKTIGQEKIHPNSMEISRMISDLSTFNKCLFYPLIYEYAIDKKIEYIYILVRFGFRKILEREATNVFQIIGPEVRKHKNLRLIPLVAKTSEIHRMAPQILNFI